MSRTNARKQSRSRSGDRKPLPRITRLFLPKQLVNVNESTLVVIGKLGLANVDHHVSRYRLQVFITGVSSTHIRANMR